MRQVNRCYEVLSQLTVGEVYSWEKMKEYSKSPGRDLKRLLDEGKLEKVGPALYSSFKMSRFGKVPPDESDLVKAFLKTDDFLMFTPNLYNRLGLGLTQLKRQTFVYNKKRHGQFKFYNRNFDFKLKPKGFPKKLDKEYLLVDLVNNLDDVGEEPSMLLSRVEKKVRANEFDNNKLFLLAKQYGHVYTKKFFAALEFGKQYPERR